MKKNECDDHDLPSTPKYFESYIRLSQERIIFVNERFTKEMSSVLSAWLLHYDHEDPNEEITIYINSVGGDASALTNIYDIMQVISAPIKTVCLGRCYSAGAVLLAAGSSGNRYILPHAEVMIHGIQCAFPIVTDNSFIDAKNYFNFLTDSNDLIMKILAKHSGHSLDKIKKDCQNDVWLNAKEAVNYGLVDHIVG